MEVELNPSGFVDMLFPPHGTYAAQIDGQLIQAQATGPFNVEMFVSHRQVLIPMLLEAGNRGRIGVLTEFHTNMLTGIEALEVYAETMAMAVQKVPNFVCIATLADLEVEGRDLMVRLLDQKVFQPTGLQYKVFDDRVAAESWLNSVIVESV